MENPSSDWFEKLTPSFIFLLAFGFALAGLNPTFFLNDSPETVTACLTFGIPHPPGYPLHTMIGHFFSSLPVGHLPFRINLFSAVLAGAVCVFLFFLLKDRLSVAPRLALLFSLFWIAGTSAYPASLSAKTGIYHLTALFLLAVLWAILGKRIGLAVFFLGLSFANHWMSMVAFLPGFFLLAYFLKKENPSLEGESLGQERVRFLILPAFFVLGLSVYILLPLRAHFNPWLDWGDPSTWHNFVFNFLRRQYSGPEGAGGPAAWVPQWREYLKTAFLEFNGLFLLALFGVVKLFFRHRDRILGLGLSWVSLVGITGIYLNLPKDQYYLINDYSLSSHVFILIFSAWGLEVLLSEGSPESRGKRERLVVGALVILLVWLGVSRYSQDRQTDYTFTYDYVLNGFKGLPRNALYYCKGDSVVFPSWYFQWVEGKRTDLAVVGVDGIPMEWVRKNLALFHKDLQVPFTGKPVGVESIPPMVDWMVKRNPNRELYFSYNKIEDGTLPGTRLVLYGLTSKGFLPGQEPVLDEGRALFCWNHLRLRHLGEKWFPLDTRTFDNVVRDYAIFRNSLGVYFEDRADDAKARLNPKSKAEDLLKIHSDYQKSYDHFSWAQRFIPGEAQYAYNTGNSLFHLGKIDESVVWYEKATQLKKDYTIAYFNWAVADLQLQRHAESGRLFEKVLDLDPKYPNAQGGLDYLVKNGLYLKH